MQGRTEHFVGLLLWQDRTKLRTPITRKIPTREIDVEESLLRDFAWCFRLRSYIVKEAQRSIIDCCVLFFCIVAALSRQHRRSRQLGLP